MSDPNPTTRVETPTPDAAPSGANPDTPGPPPSATPEAPGFAPQVPAMAPHAPPPAPSSPTAPPTWYPPEQGNPGRAGSVIVGLILLVIGLWFLADHTLGLEMPNLSLGQLWPLILIVIGGWILFAGFRRGSR